MESANERSAEKGMMQLMKPRLTTIRQDTNRIGSEAARKLVEIIESPKTTIPEITVIPCSLIEGETVARIPVTE